MRISLPCSFRSSYHRLRREVSDIGRAPLIRIKNASFYRQHALQGSTLEHTLSNGPMFPGLTYDFPADETPNQFWAIVGPANAGKTTFLEILRGQHLSIPPASRSYPYLSSEEVLAKDRRLSWPPRAIQYVGFNDREKGLSGLGTYLSARYESRKESQDFSLQDYLMGRTQLNVEEELQEQVDQSLFQDVAEELRLRDLLGMPTSNLSNGQTRRARIAKALLGKPELLLLDEPFVGLDPPTLVHLNPILRNLAYTNSPRLLLALRPQDPIPDYITHLMYLGMPLDITNRGTRDEVSKALHLEVQNRLAETQHRRKVGDENARLDELPRFNNEFGQTLLDEGLVANPDYLEAKMSRAVRRGLLAYKEGDRSKKILTSLGLKGSVAVREGNWKFRRVPELPPVGEPLVEMDGVVIKYGEQVVLGNWQHQLKMRVSSRSTALGTRLKPYLEPASSDDANDLGPGLNWTVRRGERWAIIGPNGSGKTTLLSLISSDHPQAYALPMRLFGRSRLPTLGQPGHSLFDIQSRIGHTSPEVHSFFPRNLSVRRTLESAYADAPLGRPRLSAASDARVAACLRWFSGDLNPAGGPDPDLQEEMLRFGRSPASSYVVPGDPELFRQRRREYLYTLDEEKQRRIAWADTMTFSSLTFSAQRLALFLRAIVAQPDIVILDEAFSGMDDLLRDKCLLFLTHGETMLQSPYHKNHMFFATRKIGARARRAGRLGNTILIITEGLTANQALIVVSHLANEIPAEVNNYLYLPDATSDANRGGARCVTGQARGIRLSHDPLLWQTIWDIPCLPIRGGRSKDSLSAQSQAARVEQYKAIKHQMTMGRNRYHAWVRELDRIKRSLAGEIPTPTWQVLRAEKHIRDDQAAAEKKVQTRMRVDRRKIGILTRRISEYEPTLNNYNKRIETIKGRIEAGPARIDFSREEQRRRAEDGELFRQDFARKHVARLKADKLLVERQMVLNDKMKSNVEECTRKINEARARLAQLETDHGAGSSSVDVVGGDAAAQAG